MMALSDTVSSSGNLVDSTVCVADTSKLCMVCEEAPKQYKCPRCDYFTCSLKCCKQHKVEVGNLSIDI
jgi:HIT zinc finger